MTGRPQRVVFDDTVKRGRWERDENGRRYWRGPSPTPGKRYVLPVPTTKDA